MNKKILGLTAAFGLGVAGAVDVTVVADRGAATCDADNVGKVYSITGEGGAVNECVSQGENSYQLAWKANSVDDYNKNLESAASSADATPASSADATPASSADATPASSADATPASSADATPASSADATPASSATATTPATPAVKGTIISDFSKDAGSTLTSKAKPSYWYSYLVPGNEKDGMGTATITNPVDAEYGGNKVFHEEGYMGLDGIVLDKGAYQYTPQVALGIEATAGELASCTTINYRYKGAAHYLKVQMTGEADGDPQHRASQIAATDWTTASVSAAAMKPGWETPTATTLDMAKAIKMAFVIESETTPNPNYLYIDDVACEGSATVTPGTSTTPGATVGGSSLIADFAKDAGSNLTSKNKQSYFYSYLVPGDEKNGMGTATITNEADTEYGGNKIYHEDGFVGLDGIVLAKGAYQYTPQVAIGVDATAGELTGCTAITYEYQGAGHYVKVQMTGEADGDPQHRSTVTTGATTWTPVTVSTATMQPGWETATPGPALNMANVVKMAFVIESETTPTPNYLWIKNVSCVGASIGGKPATPSQQSIKPVIAQNGLKASVNGSLLNISVAKQGLVKVAVFDMMGHVIESHSENMTAGSYTHSLANLSKGAYVVRVQQGSAVKSIRMQVR